MERQLLEVPFLGLDTKTDAKLVMPGKLAVAENVRFLKGQGIDKRFGYKPLAKNILGGSALIAVAQRLASFQNELLLMGNGELYSYSPGLGAWVDKGGISPVSIGQTPIVRNTYKQSTPDAATANGVTAYVWADSRGGVYGAAFDEESGTPLLPEALLNANGARPRVVAIGTSLVAVYIETVGGVGRVKARSLNGSNPTAWGAEQTLKADATPTLANQHLDLIPSFYPGAALFAYNATGPNTNVGYVRADATLGSPANGGYADVVSIAEASDKSLTIVLQASTGAVYVLYSNGVALRLAARYPDLTSKIAAKNVEVLANVENVTACFDAAGALATFYEVQAALPYNRKIRTVSIASDATGTVGAPADLRRSVALGAKAFLHATGVHVVGLHDPSPSGTKDGLQNTYFLFHVSGRVAACMQPGTADRIQVGALPTVVGKDANTFFWPAPARTKFISENNTTYSLVGLERENVTFASAMRTAQLGDALLITGGVMGVYDGAGAVVESGFLLAPENVSVALGGGGSGSIAAGTYSACVVFRWVDSKGQTHRSAPSVPIQFTAAANDKATFTIPTLRITDKRGVRTNVTVELYTTQVNLTVFYLTPNGAATDPVANPVYNDTTADTVTIIRQCADATIAANEILYTQGGVLENDPPRSAALLAVSKNRAFLVPGEYRRRVYFSKLQQIDEAPAFSEDLYFDVDPTGGDLTAIAVLDDKIVLFKERQIEIVAGEGPDDTGANGTFSPPVLVTTDVGCTNPDSIAVVPMGLTFKSDKGIYLLDRSLSVAYKGAPVEDFNELTITSATLVEDANEVRFTTAESNNDGGRTLVWNYFFDEWATWTNQSAVHGLVWEQAGAFVYVTSGGKVFVEVDEYFLDDNVPYSVRIVTSWLKLTGIQGFMRVRGGMVLGTFRSPHLLRARIGYDYQDSFDIMPTWDPSGVLFSEVFGDPVGAPFGDPVNEPFGGDSDTVYQALFRTQRQKCEAVRFEFSDLLSSGASFTLNALTLEVAGMRGAFRLPAGKVVG